MTSTLCVGKGQHCFFKTRLAIPPRPCLVATHAFPSGLKGMGFESTRFVTDVATHVSTLDAPAKTEHISWYDRFSEHWTSAHSEEELQEILRNETEKMIFIDFFAGFCGSCKAAFPPLSRIASDPDYQKDYRFVKCNVEDESIKAFVREQGIKGIPTAMVCAPGGEKIITFGATFRKMNAIRANLVVIAAHRESSFTIDPNGFVTPLFEA